MADAYGTLTFTKSTDCIFDGPSLVSRLNAINWDNSGGKWIYYEDEDLIGYSGCCVQYPTVFVEEESLNYCINQETGEYYKKTFSQMTEEDWENFDYDETKEISLEDFRDQFSPYLKQGWIEIACCANEKCRYVMFEALRIYSSGDAERMRAISGPCSDSSTFRESVSASKAQGA